MKFGLLTYNYTINLGNEIQSIAARRFLPKIDYNIEHHKIHEFDKDTDVKTIMNAWYLNCPEAWPPSENIDPLLVSMHFASNDFTQKAVVSDESKQYFENHGPVGCRDEYTMDFLNKNGIDAYFTGCLTLTLDTAGKYNPADEDSEYILLNCDSSKKLISYLKDKTDKKIYAINQDYAPSFKKAWPGMIPKTLYNHTSYWDSQEKLFLAENMIRLYENASCIITDRLHCALPALALETPVMLFNSRAKQDRFNGLYRLLLVSNLKEYLDDFSIFDVNNPPENSDEYIPLRKDLINKCRKFTGHINDSCYKTRTYSELLEKNALLFSKQAQDTRDYIVDVLNKSEEYEKEISRQAEIIKKQEKIITEMQNSNSWKLTGPLRKIRKK
ncbi:polysaccharide pyruvyl transferase family protein [uncultured Methanobrevibacter sp.]|uniref:polysaccharide pyruvyl transferase family protein n=1 Tax=uncultured Methanobrevibacter sp. TaxID=253161 RepID=UPI00260DEFD5|nr:polysaccharide pyruvyl transferase family protein [uncultured Methanobrevibacter sp.]